MTLCIAAICRHEKEGRLVLCSDMKGGTWAAKTENEFKVMWVRARPPAWVGLVSGDISRAYRITASFCDSLDRIELNVKNVFEAMQSAGNSFREKLANDIVSRNLSVSYDYLRKNKEEFPEARVNETYAQIKEIDSEVEMIVAGFVGTLPYIFVVERDCSVVQRTNFAAVGTGAYIAEQTLYQRHQNISFKVGKSLYHVYEAKRLAEIAEGVGRFTVLSITAPSENEELKFREVHDEGLEFLEKKYKEYGLKPTDDFELPE